MRRRLLAALAFVVVVGGCSGSPAASPTSAPTASATATPSPAVSAGPSPSAPAVLARLDTRLVFNHYAGKTVTLWGDTDSGVGPLFPDVRDEQEGASWSPDGTTLAFGVLLGSGARIFESLAGAEPTEVATGCTSPDCLEDGFPAISPDGKHLAFHRIFGSAEPTGSGIAVADALGANAAILTNVPWSSFEDKSPAWSPDGTAVVFAREDHDSAGNVTGSALYILTVATGDIRRLTPDGVAASDPDWSSNGLIVFGTPIDVHDLKTSDVSVIAPDGSSLRNLTAGTSVAGAAATPSWIEGGARVVFSRIDTSTTGAVWVMNADGSDPKQLTAVAGFNGYPAVAPN